MGLPEDKGAYVLVSRLDAAATLEIGRLGRFSLRPGWYAYVGSACGAGGLRARIARHLDPDKRFHWHIDYLLQAARPVEVWFAVSDRKLEAEWAEMMARSPEWRVAIPRFGASDYRRARHSHLFYRRRPARFEQFAARVREIFLPEVQPRRFLLEPAAESEA